MSPKPLKNIAASVHQRLLNHAKQTHRPFNELLQYFAMERFLYRLAQSKHADMFILKGALMLVAWRLPISRPTKDIDLLGKTRNDIEHLVAIAQEICKTDVEPDGLIFDAGSVVGERIAEDAEYEGVRVRFSGHLQTAIVRMQIDIGFGDTVSPAPIDTTYPTILDFPSPHLKGYNRETAIAEKLHAMIKLGVLNSRIKDFYDIWLLSRQFDFDGHALVSAIKQTFSNRSTDVTENPTCFSQVFAGDSNKAKQWSAFVSKNRLVNITSDFAEVVNDVARFLTRPLSSIVNNTLLTDRWTAPGPWGS